VFLNASLYRKRSIRDFLLLAEAVCVGAGLGASLYSMRSESPASPKTVIAGTQPKEEELKKFDEIQNIFKVFGDHSLICEVYTKSVDSLYDLIQSRILKVASIQNVEVDILIEKISLNPDAELDMLSKASSII